MKRIVCIATAIFARFLRCLFTISLLVTPGLAVTGAKADELTFELRIERGQLPSAKRLIHRW